MPDRTSNTGVPWLYTEIIDLILTYAKQLSPNYKGHYDMLNFALVSKEWLGIARRHTFKVTHPITTNRLYMLRDILLPTAKNTFTGHIQTFVICLELDYSSTSQQKELLDIVTTAFPVTSKMHLRIQNGWLDATDISWIKLFTRNLVHLELLDVKLWIHDDGFNKFLSPQSMPQLSILTLKSTGYKDDYTDYEVSNDGADDGTWEDGPASDGGQAEEEEPESKESTDDTESLLESTMTLERLSFDETDEYEANASGMDLFWPHTAFPKLVVNKLVLKVGSYGTSMGMLPQFSGTLVSLDLDISHAEGGYSQILRNIIEESLQFPKLEALRICIGTTLYDLDDPEEDHHRLATIEDALRALLKPSTVPAIQTVVLHISDDWAYFLLANVRASGDVDLSLPSAAFYHINYSWDVVDKALVKLARAQISTSQGGNEKQSKLKKVVIGAESSLPTVSECQVEEALVYVQQKLPQCYKYGLDIEFCVFDHMDTRYYN